MITLKADKYIELGEKWLDSGTSEGDFQRAQMALEVEIGIKVLKELGTDINLPLGHVAELMGLIEHKQPDFAEMEVSEEPQEENSDAERPSVSSVEESN